MTSHRGRAAGHPAGAEAARADAAGFRPTNASARVAPSPSAPTSRRAAAAHGTVERTTARALVDRLATQLAEAGIPEAGAEARDLLAALMDQPRFWPSLHPDATVPSSIIDAAVRAADRRARGAPFAYATGKAAFRFLTLGVDERVLIPRQETEVLVDLVLRARRDAIGGVLADIGTGSGALALAFATEGRFSRVIATDVSADALAVADRNVRHHAAHLRAAVELRAGAGLAPLANEVVDVLVSNPPYIAFDEADELPTSVRAWEPVAALISGADGLAVTRELVRDAPLRLRPGGMLALEVDSRRAHAVADMVTRTGAFERVSVHQDLTRRDRFVLATRR